MKGTFDATGNCVDRKITERVDRQLHDLLDFSPGCRKEKDKYEEYRNILFVVLVVYWFLRAIHNRHSWYYHSLGFGNTVSNWALLGSKETWWVSFQKICYRTSKRDK